MSFYRIYRPQVIDQIDNPVVREYLASLLSKEPSNLPHAYFLTGPKGTGKTTAARVIAKLFNCKKLGKSGPCGSCEQCEQIAKGTSLDVVEMDAASNRGIDEIRALRERINLSPISSPYTVYIIDEVHMLTTEAFNALLKTLEEPPPHAVFILATTDAHKVPGTIISRCVKLVFQRAEEKELSHVIQRIAKVEKIAIDDEAIALVAKASDGSFRDAAKLLEQLSFQKGKITKDIVERSLDLTDEKMRQKFLSAMSTRDESGALALVSLLVTDGKNIREFITDVLFDLHGLLVGIASGKPASGWTKETLTDLIRRLTASYNELKMSPIPSLPLELVVIEYCLVKEETPPAPVPVEPPHASTAPMPQPSGLLTLEKLVEHWTDFIASMKPYNHSVAGVLRSSRPKDISNGIVTIEAFYSFHQEKLADMQTRQMLADVLKKLFGEKVKVEIVLGKK